MEFVSHCRDNGDAQTNYLSGVFCLKDLYYLHVYKNVDVYIYMLPCLAKQR